MCLAFLPHPFSGPVSSGGHALGETGQLMSPGGFLQCRPPFPGRSNMVTGLALFSKHQAE